MATILHSEAVHALDFERNPLLFAVFGGLQIFRALGHLRDAAPSSSSLASSNFRQPSNLHLQTFCRPNQAQLHTKELRLHNVSTSRRYSINNSTTKLHVKISSSNAQTSPLLPSGDSSDVLNIEVEQSRGAHSTPVNKMTGMPPSWLQAATVGAGAVSRTLAQIAIHPLDTLKTRMQVHLRSPQLQVWRAVTSCPATRVRALAAWASPAGARDLCLGLESVLGGVLPASALYFATEQCVRGWLADRLRTDSDSAPCRLTASAAAAALSALIRVPSDVIKHRVQAYAYPTARHAFRDILGLRGPRGLYAGFGATLLRDAPEIVIQFTVYRYLKGLLEDSHHPTQQEQATATTEQENARAARHQTCGSYGAVQHLMLGGAAGAAAALATTPLDVVKTQLQCGAASSVGAAIRGTLRSGGPAALFGGLAPRVLQATLCSAIFFTCFEASKARLGDMAGMTATSPAPAAPEAVAAVTAAAAAVKLSAASCWEGLQQGHRKLQWRRGGRSRGHGGFRNLAAGRAHQVQWGPWATPEWSPASCPLVHVALYAYAYAGTTALPVPSPALPLHGR